MDGFEAYGSVKLAPKCDEPKSKGDQIVRSEAVRCDDGAVVGIVSRTVDVFAELGVASVGELAVAEKHPEGRGF